VESDEIVNFGNGYDPIHYGIGIEKNDEHLSSNKFFEATEDCFFFPCGYTKAVSKQENLDECWPIYVFVGDSRNCDYLYKVFSHDGSEFDLCASWMVPLKKGQILTIWSGGLDTTSNTNGTGFTHPKSYWLPVKS
jgi:hypothetical protein